MAIEIPKKYYPGDAEERWRARWDELGLYRWDPDRPRGETFVVDTPPPTVSGSLHIGHVFSYTQQDLIVRYWRMRGRNIAYPMGWDDNGLPTERRVENLIKIRPNPRLPYDPDWKPRRDTGKGTPKKRWRLMHQSWFRPSTQFSYRFRMCGGCHSIFRPCSSSASRCSRMRTNH